MEALLDHLVHLLRAAGPWIVFATTFLETAVFVGLLIPAEPVVLLAAVLVVAGKFSLHSVVIATFLGALLGDQAGYALGRFGGNRVIARGGRIARIWQRYEPTAARLFRRQAIISVTLARFISFVRTLMPWFAGMSRMPYARFFFYDLVGVLAWTTALVSVGYAAGESWRVVAEALGTASAYLIGAILVIALVFVARDWRSKRVLARRGVVRVALTGNIGSGKSSVANVWRTLGAPIIDADVLARRALKPGTRGFKEVVRQFGPGVIVNGVIDRAHLRGIVFKNEGRRKTLESIVHPAVARLRASEERRLASTGARVIVNDIPLLFETGLQNDFDVVVVVDAPENVRIDRIMRDRGLTREEALSMVVAQMPADEKRLPGTFVIDNNGTLKDLQLKAEELWQDLLERGKR